MDLFQVFHIYLVDTIQVLDIKLGMKLWVNWTTRNILLLNMNVVRCLDIIKDLFQFFCRFPRICLNQRHNTEKLNCFQLKPKAELRPSILFTWKF